MKKVRIGYAAQVAAGGTTLVHEGEATEWFLSWEDYVLKRLGISQPTLGQAARLGMCRGVGRGGFGHWPNCDAVTHMVAISLRSAGTSYGDLIRTFAFLSSEVAQLAANNPDAGSRPRVINLVNLVQG